MAEKIRVKELKKMLKEQNQWNAKEFKQQVSQVKKEIKYCTKRKEVSY